MKEKSVKKVSLLVLAIVMCVTFAGFSVTAFRGSAAEEPTYYTKSEESMTKIDFSATKLVVNAETDTFTAGGQQEFFEGTAIGTSLDTVFTAAISFSDQTGHGYGLAFKRGGWANDGKVEIYLNGTIKLFKSASDNQEFKGAEFVKNTWYYLEYTIMNLYSDAELTQQVGYRSKIDITDKADYNVSYQMDFLNEETTMTMNTGNFFIWCPAELLGVKIASAQYNPQAEPPEEMTFYAKDESAFPQIDFSKTGLVVNKETDTFTAGGQQEFFEGTAIGTSLDTVFTAAISFSDQTGQGYGLAFKRGGWANDGKVEIYLNGTIKLFKSASVGQEFKGAEFAKNTWYYIKYTIMNLYSDEELTQQVGYRSKIDITDKVDYNVSYQLDYLNEEAGTTNTGNFFIWCPTELLGVKVASYMFDPEATPVVYEPAVNYDEAETLDISKKIRMNADGIVLNSDAYKQTDGYYANFTEVFEMNKKFTFAIRGSGSLYCAFAGSWTWGSYKVEFKFNENELKFGNSGDNTSKIVKPNPALKANELYNVEIGVVEYFEKGTENKGYEIVHCAVYEAATNTKVAEEALQFTGPSGIPEDGSRGYFGFFMNPQGNAFTVMPVDFERTYAVNVVNGDFSTQVSAEYGKNYDLSEYVAQRDGYEFKGWEYVKDGKTEIIPSAGVWKTDFTTQSGGVYTGTLTAKYVPVEYKITYVIEGGSNAAENPASINVEDGVVALKPAVPDSADNVFFGWYDNAQFSGEPVAQIECEMKDVTLYAKIAEGCSLTLVAPDGSEQVVAVEKNKEFTLPKLTSVGYSEEIGWEKKDGDDWVAVSGDKVTPQGNETYRAVAEPIAYTITYVLDGGSNHADNPASFTVEDTFVFANAEKKGFFFVGWYQGETLVKGVNLGTTGNIEITAKFVKDTLPAEWNVAVGSSATLLPIPSGLPAGAHYTVKLYNAAGEEQTISANSFAFAAAGEYKLVYEITLLSGTVTREVKVKADTPKIVLSGSYKESYKAGETIDIVSANAGGVAVNVVVKFNGNVVEVQDGKITLKKGTYTVVYSAEGAQDVTVEFKVSGKGCKGLVETDSLMILAAAICAACVFAIVKKSKDSVK